MKRLLSYSFLLLIFPVSSFAGWSWLYPQPQGHDLSDIVFLDNTTAIAVGEGGTILVTHDTGDHWAVQSMVLGNASTLRHVEGINASTAVAVGDGGVILRSHDGGTTWDQIVSGTSTNLLDVSFADAQHGVAVSASRALRSSDGGITWEFSLFSGKVAAVDMINPAYVLALEAPDSLLRSHDGGETWSAQKVPAWGYGDFAGYRGQFEFADSLLGFISGSTSFATDDGGVTWNPTDVWAPSSFEIYAQELACNGAEQVFAAFSVRPDEYYPSGVLSLTVNHGQEWTQAGGSNALVINGLAINSDGVVVTVGERGAICRRAINGTFTRISGPVPARNSRPAGAGISFFDPDHGVVMKSNDGGPWDDPYTSIARTTDGGATWSSSSTFYTLTEVIHVSGEELYGVAHADILHSVDGGATWEGLSVGGAGLPGRALGIAFGSATHGIAVGEGGKVVVIDGTTANAVATGIDAVHEGVAFASTLRAVAVGQGGVIARTDDGGQTWDPITSPTSNDLFDVDFVTNDEGCAVGSNVVLRTHNGGENWDPIPVSPVGKLLDVDFIDQLHGIAVGQTVSSNGIAFSTEDGGDTWVLLEVPTPTPLTNVIMFSQTHAYIGGQRQFLFDYKSTTVPTLFSSFTATPKPSAAELRWIVQDESNLAAFRLVRRSISGVGAIALANIEAGARTYTDDTVRPGQAYEFTLVAVERNGEEIPSVPVRVSIPEASLELFPNQPNPFNPSTTIGFVLAEKGRVVITVHDVAGRVVATLLDAVREAGRNSVVWDGGHAPSGVYFVRLSAGKAVASRKMVLLK